MTPIKENRDWEEEFDDLFEPIDGSLFQNYPATIMIMKKFIGSVLVSHEAKAYERGLKQTAITVDKNFVEFLKSQESHGLLEEIKSGIEAKVKEYTLKKIMYAQVNPKHWDESDEYDKGMSDMKATIINALAQSSQEE